MELPGFRPPVELDGRWVRLVPLGPEQARELVGAGADPRVWAYLPYPHPRDEPSMRSLIALLLDRQAHGTDLAFAVLDRATGRPIGMTRFLEIDRAHRRAEIGGTWYDPRLWRTPVNTEAKRLLFGYAFERERANRVQLKTDLRNERSQRAIERLGAIREGVLRGHMVMPDGVIRSSVVYSVLAEEWPAVRARLDAFLERPWPRPTAP